MRVQARCKQMANVCQCRGISYCPALYKKTGFTFICKVLTLILTEYIEAFVTSLG